MDAEQRRAAIAEKMQSVPTRQNGQPRTFGNPKPFTLGRKKIAKVRTMPADRLPGYKTGRPSLYRPEYCDVAIEIMSKGHSITGLAGHLRVSHETIYQWIGSHADFAEAIKVGRGARVLMLENKLLTTQVGPGVVASIFALKNAAPDEYQDQVTTNHNVNVQITKVSDEQLMQIISRAKPTLIAPPNATPTRTTDQIDQ
jgi:hypothetical protein